jgi:hypothetical protein
MSKKKVTRTNDPQICEMTGDICVSLSGRDAGSALVVIGRSENGYVYVADGKARKISAPKLKNSKHISVFAHLDGAAEEQLRSGRASDAMLRKAISAAVNEKLC